MPEDTSPILLIFDLDGTIGNTGGVGKTAFELTFCDIYGISKSAEGIKPFGKTDQIIFEELLSNNNIQFNDFSFEFTRFSSNYIANFERLISESEKPFLYDGVESLINILDSKDQLHLALGTGNLQETAYLHLRKHNLDRFFPTGGFSNQVKHRPQLIKLAFDNAVEHYRKDFNSEQTWVIGDTPSDISAGKENGFQTIAVATGPFSTDQLTQHEPDAILNDLMDTDQFLSIVQNRI